MTKGVHTRYSIGVPGAAWGDAERSQWLQAQVRKRDYFNDVVSPLLRFSGGEVFQYGSLDYRKYGAAKYPLFAVKSKNWCVKRPLAIITGGVHGYETSGIHGALLFISEQFERFSQVNVLVLPCISPWGYEHINRWTPEAVDPNRCFVANAPGCPEAANAMACVMIHTQQSSSVLMHIDLHETTDTDNSEFTPAKAARDGADIPTWDPIPDGFYIIGDEPRPQLEWQQTMIQAVKEVTHIAEPEDGKTLLGEPVVSPGILICPAIGDCASHTTCKFSTTTEVYPDSSRTNPEECNRAQMICVVSGLQYAVEHQ